MRQISTSNGCRSFRSVDVGLRPNDSEICLPEPPNFPFGDDQVRSIISFVFTLFIVFDGVWDKDIERRTKFIWISGVPHRLRLGTWDRGCQSARRMRWAARLLLLVTLAVAEIRPARCVARPIETARVSGKEYVRLSDWAAANGFEMRWVKRDET